MKPQNVFLLIAGILLAPPLHAYWSKTHQQFAEDAYDGNNDLSAIEESESMADYYTNRLGFPLNRTYLFNNVEPLNPITDYLSVKDNGIWAITIQNETLKGSEIFTQGADDEDYPTARATNHFFVPVHNQSLRESIESRFSIWDQIWSQYDDGIARFTAASEEAIKTPDWALEPVGWVSP